MLILAIIAIYFVASMETARRVSWTWNNNRNKDPYTSDGARQFLAIMLSLLALPVMAYIGFTSDRSGGVLGFDKAPRAVRKEEKRRELEATTAEAERMVNRLQREIDQLAKQ